ncbi:O-methyltransferase [Dermacoccaceae bacterium W4C1]
MSTMRPTTWAYAEEFPHEPTQMESARRAGAELSAPPVPASTGSLLSVLAAAVGARTVVEIGTGAGTSGLWLLRGMPSDGVLTTIDIDGEHQRVAKRAYAEAGYPAQRTRTITGRALEVLPRLTDGAYDLVLIDARKDEYPQYVEQARRLLRPGGLMLLDNMLWHDRVADPTVRDEVTVLLRDLGKSMRDDEGLLSALVPVGDGLFAAVRR